MNLFHQVRNLSPILFLSRKGKDKPATHQEIFFLSDQNLQASTQSISKRENIHHAISKLWGIFRKRLHQSRQFLSIKRGDCSAMQLKELWGRLQMTQFWEGSKWEAKSCLFECSRFLKELNRQRLTNKRLFSLEQHRLITVIKRRIGPLRNNLNIPSIVYQNVRGLNIPRFLFFQLKLMTHR